jgi:hypothetical protein
VAVDGAFAIDAGAEGDVAGAADAAGTGVDPAEADGAVADLSRSEVMGDADASGADTSGADGGVRDLGLFETDGAFAFDAAGPRSDAGVSGDVSSPPPSDGGAAIDASGVMTTTDGPFATDAASARPSGGSSAGCSCNASGRSAPMGALTWLLLPIALVCRRARRPPGVQRKRP